MNISQITDHLFIAAHPGDEHAEDIEALGVRLILNMIWHRPAKPLTQPPFHMLTLRTFDSPRLKISVRTLQKGVEAALPVIAAGDKVLVYCREGRHRSVAMTSCILIGQGLSADEAMQLVKARRPVADPYAPHIESQIRAFAEMWQGRNQQSVDS